MNLTPRQAVKLLGTAGIAVVASGRLALATYPVGINVTSGRYRDTRDSLKGYAIPVWFADAKFGIWSHWEPQSAIGDGDWYARRMDDESSPKYKYPAKQFGPQSKFGYDNAMPLFTADEWDPDYLIGLYQQAGAKYFFSMGMHHDNYDMWNLKYQPHWKAVATGPKKDIVEMWCAAARKRVLRLVSASIFQTAMTGLHSRT